MNHSQDIHQEPPPPLGAWWRVYALVLLLEASSIGLGLWLSEAMR